MISKMIHWSNLKEAQKFTNILSQYPVDADLVQGHTEVDAKSFVGICSLNPNKKVELRLYSGYGDELMERIEPYVV